ncbi:hypothetical protein [Dactylosporangium maewongense]
MIKSMQTEKLLHLLRHDGLRHPDVVKQDIEDPGVTFDPEQTRVIVIPAQDAYRTDLARCEVDREGGRVWLGWEDRLSALREINGNVGITYITVGRWRLGVLLHEDLSQTYACLYRPLNKDV